MKKTVISAFCAAAVLTAFAGEVKFDNRFLSDGKQSVKGWLYNNAAEFKPFGDVLPVMNGGQAGVRLVSKGKYTAIYLENQIPAVKGDILKFSFRIQGTGRYGIGIYQYGSKAKWQWRGASIKYGNANYTSPVPVDFEVPVNAEDTKNVCPVLIADANADISFFGLKIEKNPKK